MMMALIWTLILFLHITNSAEAVGVSKESFLSVGYGKKVTLHCKFEGDYQKSTLAWYKERAGQERQELAMKLSGKKPAASLKRLKISDNFSLTIEQTTKDDEGMYFCGEVEKNITKFSKGTFVAVKGPPQFNISVVQTPVLGSVSPGESVTLQCTVLSEIRTAELRVLWFRAAAEQSFPEIIYIHQNSRQCEISSSTNCSVYKFSMSNFSHSDVGTYYCAVAACGKIIVGNGASVNFRGFLEADVIFLGAALGVCVIVISVQAFIIYKRRNSELCSERKQQDSATENTTRQDPPAENLNYAPIHFKEKKPRTGRGKREQPEDIVYSQVRSSNAKAHRSHR